jgi:hypothetical protein
MELGGSKLRERFAILDILPRDALKGVFPSEDGRIRKLSAIQDKEGKSRVVAVFDYFSQIDLRGVNDQLYKVLKRIPQDCTFNQMSFKEKVKS